MPINSNKTYDNMGKSYNVSKIINERGSFDNEKYQKYSEPWMAAGNLALYFFFFAMYSSSESLPLFPRGFLSNLFSHRVHDPVPPA